MVSGLDDSLGGVEDAPLLRSVIVVVASVPCRAPEEWRGRMDADVRGKSMALAPACTIPVIDKVQDYYGLLHCNFLVHHNNLCSDGHFLVMTYH